MQRVSSWKFLALSFLLALAWPGLGKADPSAEVRGIQADFEKAWNAHDAKALAQLWAADGDLVSPGGRKAQGTAAIEALFAEEHAGPFASSSYHSECGEPRFLSDDVVVLDCSFVVDGARAGDGSATRVKGLQTGVYVRTASGFRIALARAMVPVTPLGQPRVPGGVKSER